MFAPILILRRNPKWLGASLRAIGGFACALGLVSIAIAGSFPGAVPDDSARMQITADYLVRVQLPSGMFPYDYDFASGIAEDMNDMSGMNVVRQGVALFGLVQYLELSDSQQLRETAAKALRAFAERSLPVGKGEVQSVLEDIGAYNRWQLWRILRAPLNSAGLLYTAKGNGALVSANGSYERAWTGASALALVSELIYRSVTKDESFARTREGWLNGLLALRVPRRGVREAPHYLSESPYVNGQAWLAFAEYSRAFPNDRRIATTLSELDDYLIDRYGGSPSVLFYHWGAMAAARRWETTGDPRFSRFIRKQSSWYLEQITGRSDEPGNSCVSVEGLATAYRILRPESGEQDPLMISIRSQVEHSMSHSRKLQIQPGQEFFVLDNGVEVRSPQFAANVGAFVTSSTQAKVQVDWAGHCLSALVRMQEAGLAR